MLEFEPALITEAEASQGADAGVFNAHPFVECCGQIQ
jgi:hypothetical protein